MDAWLTGSPYWAVGIYLSGDSRGCLSQPNLTPAWVSTQLAHGWRLLPITLGPQASCTTRERYLHQVRIHPSPTGSYASARRQGRAEARKTVAAARRLGISARSTLWYDLESFATSSTRCRESALSFLSAWTDQLHDLRYVSGVYSSAASGIKILDDARTTRPGRYRMPDRIWIADWNGRADVASSYVRRDGWTSHRRVHQYRGGHDETHGGVRINIDTDWLDLGRGSTPPPEPRHCGGAAAYDYGRYPTRAVGDRGSAGAHRPVPAARPRRLRRHRGRRVRRRARRRGAPLPDPPGPVRRHQHDPRPPGSRCCPRATRRWSRPAAPRSPSAASSGP